MISVTSGHAWIRRTQAVALLSVLVLPCLSLAGADELSIEEAGRLALASDASLQALEPAQEFRLEHFAGFVGFYEKLHVAGAHEVLGDVIG